MQEKSKQGQHWHMRMCQTGKLTRRNKIMYLLIIATLWIPFVKSPIDPVHAAEPEVTIVAPIQDIAEDRQEEIGPGIRLRNLNLATSSVATVSVADPAPPEPHENMEPYDTTVYISYRGGLNIRSVPSTDGEILGEYQFGDQVHVLKRGNGWLYTELGDYIWESSTTTQEPLASNLVSLGKFKVTAYCTCQKCIGKNWKNPITRTGTRPVEGRTISVDPRIIPLGSKVVINGHEYIAEDTGSGVKGKVVDMFIDGHQRALNWGVQYLEVYVYSN